MEGGMHIGRFAGAHRIAGGELGIGADGEGHGDGCDEEGPGGGAPGMAGDRADQHVDVGAQRNGAQV